MSAVSETRRHAPVLIIGGGPAGLTTSILLSSLGVKSLLVERRTGGSGLPKAHIISPRSMEILSQCGVADRVLAVSSAHEYMSQTVWMTSLAGPTDLHGRELARSDSWGGGHELPAATIASPFTHTNLPQIHLEPILQDRARELAPDDVLFQHELEDLHQGHDGLVGTVTDLKTGASFEVAADYAVAADGGRTVGPMLGVKELGERGLVKMITTYLRAPGLPEVNPDPRVSIYWFINPDHGGSIGSGILVKMGGRGWGTDADEWAFSIATPPDDETEYGEEDVIDRVRAAVGVPDLEIEVMRVSEWQIESIVAERFSVGRVFLVGDAAHHHPPTGGLGMNSALQDAHNLVWKLAIVLSGKAGDGLLATYDSERRPVATRNADQSLNSFFQHAEIDGAIGISPDDPQGGWSAIGTLLSSRDEGTAAADRVASAVHGKRREFCALNLELGYCYEDGALVPDGSTLAERCDDVTDFVACTRPGHRMPHAWLERDGTRLSTYDIARYGRFTLFAGPDGDWHSIGAEASTVAGMPLDVVTIGPGGDFDDPTGAWERQREIDGNGAVLVRPDQHVAWRSRGRPAEPGATVAEALLAVLRRTAPILA
jgi:2,4-dichlorophenol 6-monooxygenase